MKILPTKRHVEMSRKFNEIAFDVLDQAWKKLERHVQQKHPNRLTPESPRFVDYAWLNFNPETVISILISDKKFYEPLKKALFSGFCTWVVCPNRPALRRHGMLLIGIEHMCKTEKLGRAAFPGQDLLGDTFGRLCALGPDFYNDFYYPIGGLSSLLMSTTPGNFVRSLEKRSVEIQTIVALMKIYHFHVTHLHDSDKYYQASLNKGSVLVEKIFKDKRENKAGVVSDNVNDRWQRLGKTAALVYAASNIEIEPGLDLLTAIRTSKSNFEEDEKHLQKWLSYARYAVKNIIQCLHKPKFADINAEYLPAGEILPIPLPVFDSEEQILIKNMFRK